MTVFSKDVDSTTDYSVDWSTWLTASETISSLTWSVSPSENASDIELSNQSITGSLCGVHVSGGQRGYRYLLTCRIVTDAGRSDDRSLTLRITER